MSIKIELLYVNDVLYVIKGEAVVAEFYEAVRNTWFDDEETAYSLSVAAEEKIARLLSGLEDTQ